MASPEYLTTVHVILMSLAVCTVGLVGVKDTGVELKKYLVILQYV